MKIARPREKTDVVFCPFSAGRNSPFRQRSVVVNKYAHSTSSSSFTACAFEMTLSAPLCLTWNCETLKLRARGNFITTHCTYIKAVWESFSGGVALCRTD